MRRWARFTVGKKENKIRSGRSVLVPPELERGAGRWEEPPARRNILCVVRRPTVAKMRSLRNAFSWKKRGFCRVRPRGDGRPCFCRCSAKRRTALHIAVAKVQGPRVPGALAGPEGPWLAHWPRSPGPADTGRLPRRHFLSAAFRRAVAGSHDGCAVLPGGGRAASPAGLKPLLHPVTLKGLLSAEREHCAGRARRTPREPRWGEPPEEPPGSRPRSNGAASGCRSPPLGRCSGAVHALTALPRGKG